MKLLREIKAIVACRDSNGVPTLVDIQFTTTTDKIYVGEHYEDIAEPMEDLGYEGPFIVMDENDFKSMGEPLRTVIESMDWTKACLLGDLST